MKVFRPADVHPGASEDVGVGTVVVLKHLVHQVVEAERFILGHQVEHFGVHRIHAHTAREMERGLFPEADNTLMGVGFQHSEGDVDLLQIGADGEWAAELLMLAEEFGEVEVGEQVAIHDEEWSIETLDEFERAHGSQRLCFGNVADAHAPLGAVATVHADHVTQVADADGRFTKALAGELAEHDFENGHAANGHQRFGQYLGVGIEARAFAAGLDDDGRVFRKKGLGHVNSPEC